MNAAGLKRVAGLLIVLCLGLASCQQQVSQESLEVLNVFPHDPNAFTQGLLFHDGRLYESTGLNGRSSLREVDLATGNVIRQLPVDDAYFAEGLARVGNDLIQLTWRSGKAFRYDMATFNLLETYTYDTEGWGLCYNGTSLIMSDGSNTLYERDATNFELIKTHAVTLNGEAVRNLNELECVGAFVYANVWQTDTIVKIDASSGRVVAEIDASGLLPAQARAGLDPNAVLNGIAYNPESETFYITGKLWPSMFEVRFVKN